jgi:hypothetical protein
MEIHRISCQNIDKTDRKIGGKYYKVEQSLARRICDESMTTVIRLSVRKHLATMDVF